MIIFHLYLLISSCFMKDPQEWVNLFHLRDILCSFNLALMKQVGSCLLFLQKTFNKVGNPWMAWNFLSYSKTTWSCEIPVNTFRIKSIAWFQISVISVVANIYLQYHIAVLRHLPRYHPWYWHINTKNHWPVRSNTEILICSR